MSKKKAYIIFTYIISSILIILMSISVNSKDDINWSLYTVIITLHILISFYCMKQLNISLLNIASIFLILIFITHYAQFVLLSMTSYIWYRSNFITMYPAEIFQKAFLECIIMTSCIVFGFLVVGNKQISLNSYNLSLKEKSICKNFAVIILITSLPFRFYEDARRILLYKSYGYDPTAIAYEMNGVLRSIGSFCILGIIFLFYAYKNNTKVINFIYFTSVIYFCIAMLSGNRMQYIFTLAVLTYYYLKIRELKLSVKKVILLFMIFWIFTSLLAAIRTLRNESIVSFGQIVSTISEKLFNQNSILQELEEFGQTIYTCSATLDYLNMTNNYGNGLTYLKSLIVIFPNFNDLVDKISDEAAYGITIQSFGIRGGYINIGGSILGELIFNFKHLYGVVAFLIGMGVSKLSNYIENNIKTNKYYMTVLLSPVVFALMLWIRGYFVNGVRVAVWGLIYFITISKLLKINWRQNEESN